MFLYFDKQGILKEIINDDKVRLGSVKSNRIYCYFEDDNFDEVLATFKHPDGVIDTEVSILLNRENIEIPYDKNRDLKYFEDYREYKFYYYEINTNSSGLALFTVRTTYGNTINAKGMVTLNVEENVIKVDHEITQSQYDYLISFVGQYNGRITQNEIDISDNKNEIEKKFDKAGGFLSGTIYFDNQTEIPYIVSTNEDVGMKATNNQDITVGEFAIKNNNSDAYGGANVNIKVFATNRRKSYSLRLSPNKKLTLYIEDYDAYGKPIGATEKIVSYDDEVQFKINGLEYAINNTIREIEEGTKVVGKAKDYSNDGTIKNKFDEIENSKLNKIFNEEPIANELGADDYFIINSGGVPYKLPARLLKNGTQEHYKGDYTSYEALVSVHPTSNPGDYAFINVEDKLIMYIWDEDDNSWRETTTDKFVNSSAFYYFQQDLLNGNFIVNKTKNYDINEGNIKETFDKINDDIINLPDTIRNTSLEFCYNLVVNVNNMQFPDVKFVEFTYGNYSGKRMVTNDSNETIIDNPVILKAYMKFMTGNDYIPTYDISRPLNVYLVTFDGVIYKMQYTTDLGLCAFYMKKVATQNYVDEKIGDINSILATLVTVEE